MKLDVYNLKAEKVSDVELPEEIFAAKVNVDLMHQAFQRQLANARLGTHNTKRRGEVRGGAAKPFKQKGTGRARRGSMKSTQHVGGGRVFTPKPRDYSQEMPRKISTPWNVMAPRLPPLKLARSWPTTSLRAGAVTSVVP